MDQINFPKISIITPNFNGGRYLERTISSILLQDYQNIELIIIDGGSTDNSVEIIKKFEQHISYWVSEPDNGLYYALEKGFSVATGEILCYLNSDDIYVSGALSTVAKIFSTNKQINWLTGQPSFVNEYNSLLVFNSYIYPRFSFYGFLAGDYKFIQQESTFWTKKLYEKIDFKKILINKYAGDFALWVEFFKYERLYFAPTLFGCFRLQRPGLQLSSKFHNEYLQECESILNDIRNSLPIKERLKVIFYRLDRKFMNSRFNKRYRKLKVRENYLKFSPELQFNLSTQEFKVL